MPELRSQSECVSDLALDQVLGGIADAGQGARVQAHLATCVRCGVRYEALATQRAGFLERMPDWQHLHARHTAAASSGRARRWRWAARAAGAGGAIAASVVLALSLAHGGATPGLRSKGAPRISAYVKRGEQVSRVDSGASVLPGDYVRFTYSSDQPVHFALLNRDARRVTTYFPLGAQTERVAAGHDVALDFSIKLDAEPGSEQVHGLFCDRPEPLEPLRDALQATGRLPPLPHCRVDVFTLEKAAAQ